MLAAAVASACAGSESSSGATQNGAVEQPQEGDTTPLSGSNTPLTIDNCGVEITIERPPERVVPLNKPATEILLALGLQDRIAAAAGEPDEHVAPEVADSFEQLDIMVESGYPSAETLFDLEPDFVYAAYPSAYREDDEGVASRDTFRDLGIPTFLSHGRCPDRDESEPMSIEEIWAEIEEIGTIFGVEDRAAALIEQQRKTYEDTLASLDDLPPMSVFWWDMKTDAPFVGACCGAPGMIIESLGFANIFDDIPGHWADASWEQVIERDPDMIVIADFGDGDIDTKLDFLTSDPALSQLRAVQEDAIVTLPFARTTPGIQTVATIGVLAEAARNLDVS
ncbi:hypothetical protein EF847_22540 [Actinobacteria bacterium YIM 96077]|uniref:Fe/B12 periplasmic-binding domain-containing protein n=1 Tax=Phytoactinopolyspora halophila TaxID=1981511 RepID=A0A329QPD3_9ACTN|nr:hypothetical protein EF847_22540 [Actinobacteria bacterium YIM 96077]RAW14225.1 hypothetical protein DPM12_10980 [Phytoactinopolyspora halophila]